MADKSPAGFDLRVLTSLTMPHSFSM